MDHQAPTPLLPVHLEREPGPAFWTQLEHLRRLLAGVVTWLDPVAVDAVAAATARGGGAEGAAGVVLPDLTGHAYRSTEALRRIEVPLVVVTSEFGTVSMWDWEIRDYLRRRGVATVAPTSLQELHDVCRALGVKASLPRSTMLAYQDDLGGGKQPDIFKRFYWWEQECVSDLHSAFGVTVERRSFKALAARAASIPERRLGQTRADVERTAPMVGLTGRAKDEGLRLYLALRDELDETPGTIAMGINCLNESATSPTTPCLAWNLLFEERGLIWGCEADLTSMITKHLVHGSLGVPVIMTNLYPFLMGDAALKHEKIPYFPEVDHPEDHLLVAHCGFLGVVPQSFSTSWALKPPVLEIVDENAHAIDARIAEGPTTILKITSTMDSLVVTPAAITNYEQYADSDCLNGAVLRVEDGYRFVERLPSHHAVLATGDITRRLDVVSQVLGLDVERV